MVRTVSTTFSARHYHIKCTKCGKFMNVENFDYIPNMDEKVASVTGYKMNHHDIVFSGVCPNCQKIAEEHGDVLGDDEN